MRTRPNGGSARLSREGTEKYAGRSSSEPTDEFPREPTLSEIHVYTSRPSLSFVLRAGVPQRSTTSSYVALSQLSLASVSSAGAAQPASTTTISVAILIRSSTENKTPRRFLPGALSCSKARRPNGWRKSQVCGLIRCSRSVVRSCLVGLSRDHLLSKLWN